MSVLSPIDLLLLSPDEQSILRCLSRAPYQIPAEIAKHTGMSLARVELTLTNLVKHSRIVEQLRANGRTYSARFQFKNRKVRNMPTQILDFYQRSAEGVLADVPLLADLSEQEQEGLRQLSFKRTLIPEEVLFWQGQKLDVVGVVANGLLKQTEIRGRGNNQTGDYLRRTDWIGLEETLGDYATQTTCTAVTETTLLLWSADDFYAFVRKHAPTLVHLNKHLIQKLRDCESVKKTGQGKLWVIDGAETKVGTTTIASSIAYIAQKNLNGDGRSHVLFWPHPNASLPPNLLADSTKIVSGIAHIQKHQSGFDVLTNLEPNNYPANVRLDMLMNSLLRRYEYIVCDAGEEESDFLLGLRGNAHTVITLATSDEQIEASWERWQKFRQLASPGQKKILALNKANTQSIEADPRFHLVIPNDQKGVRTMMGMKNIKEARNNNIFIQAIEEVYRRLSLTHSIAIFVPSTMDVNQSTDNSQQVQTALSFLGSIFGGATSSDAEGVWRSDDNGLVTEQVTVVRTFVSKKALNSHLDNILDFASQLKKEMKQEAVAVSVDNQMILV